MYMMATTSSGIKISIHEDISHKQQNGAEKQRTSLISSTDARSYGTVHAGNFKTGYLVHQIQKSDTLQGIALRYEVPVAEIQRANRLFPSESIHLRFELKIPYLLPSAKNSPRSSPKNMLLRNSSNEEEEEDEPEVRMKPIVAGERDIATMLSAIDQQLKVSRDFADKLGRKTAATKPPLDAYNRETPPIEQDPKSSKSKRTFKLPNTKQSVDKDVVEDELFSL